MDKFMMRFLLLRIHQSDFTAILSLNAAQSTVNLKS